MSDEVQVGQIWRDCDKRMQGRHIRVKRICSPLHPDGETFAVVNPCTAEGMVSSQRETRINVKRMKPGPTGYELQRP